MPEGRERHKHKFLLKLREQMKQCEEVSLD